MTLVSEKDINRFVQKFATSERGCYLWLGSKTKAGYGQFHIGKRKVLAHRFSYFVLKEHLWEIPLGTNTSAESVSHLCGNTSCVSPEHLVLEPLSDNKQRSSSRITHCPAGHPLDKNISQWSFENQKRRKCSACQRENSAIAYGVMKEAAECLGMTVTEYQKAFGKSVGIAKIVLERNKA